MIPLWQGAAGAPKPTCVPPPAPPPLAASSWRVGSQPAAAATRAVAIIRR